MNRILTAKNQVTLPKAVRDYLGVSPGERVTFELMPDGRVAIAVASTSKNKRVVPIASLRGSATRKMKTDAVMRLTRGEGWNKP